MSSVCTDTHSALEQLQPEALWRYFSDICRIPHCSGNEHALGDFICGIARDKGCTLKKDAAGNICLCVPATPGHEMADTVILQAHLDMVCEKEVDCTVDFATAGIEPVRDGEWIRANGTSLGADNGIGIAAALAAGLSPQCVHGPLEILLTLAEETGLKGAMKLDPALLSGSILFNLDSEKTGAVCIGCAGGCRMTVRLPLHVTPAFPDQAALEVCIHGLRGGHSGLDIHENRGNAIKLLAQVLAPCRDMKTSLFSLAGGDAHNAIPRTATAVIGLPSARVETLRTGIRQHIDLLARHYSSERDIALRMREVPLQERAVPPVVVRRILNLLLGLPSGVLAMNRDMPGMVDTSCNLGAARIKGIYFEAELMPRSACSQAMTEVAAQVNAVSELAGADCASEVPYPGWQPDPASSVLLLVEDVHERLFGRRPRREATHAGLECGIIKKKCPGIDMISFGPDIVNCHSPSEKVHIPGVEKFWLLLTGALERIAAQPAQPHTA